ncbi:MAG: hypothetical protein AAGA55_09280 [Planctomycetota bacterium]
MTILPTLARRRPIRTDRVLAGIHDPESNRIALTESRAADQNTVGQIVPEAVVGQWQVIHL